MGPRGWWVRFVGIALMSVLVIALAQTATPPATAVEPYVVVTSAEQILGTWRSSGARIRFDEDGTFRSAWSADTLESAPYAISSYRFEDAVMLVTELAVSGVPTCGDAVGRYAVWLLDSGGLQVVPIDDPCPGRSDNMTRVYAPTETGAFVVAASADQVIGTWVSRIGPSSIRFDEDGTCREAWGASMLDTAPFAVSTYRFDEAVMLVTAVANAGVPSCGEVGRYEVRLLENGGLQMVVIEDPCDGRREHMGMRVYGRVE